MHKIRILTEGLNPLPIKVSTQIQYIKCKIEVVR